MGPAPSPHPCEGVRGGHRDSNNDGGNGVAADMDEHVNEGKLLDVVECNCHKCMATKPVSA
jgi:hypothetical protein